MFKKKKKLLACGDSFTDPDFVTSDPDLYHKLKDGWPMWPELVARELNLDVVNLGKCGAGNDYIFDSTSQYINTHYEEIDTVMVLWSDFQRFALGPSHLKMFVNCNSLLQKFKPDIVDPDMLDNIKRWRRGLKDDLCITDEFPKKFLDLFYTEINSNVNQNYNRLINMYHICKRYEIKLVMFYGLKPFRKNDTFSDKMVETSLVMSEMYDELEKISKHIVGWPGFQSLGGYNSQDTTYKHRISDFDTHPNATGQWKISKEFLQKYRELYCV